MTSKDTIRSYQHALADHVQQHRRATTRLEQAVVRRTEVAAAQDKVVAAAKSAVDRTVVDMARALGPDLTSALIGIEPALVRRLLRADSAVPATSNREHRSRRAEAQTVDGHRTVMTTESSSARHE